MSPIVDRLKIYNYNMISFKMYMVNMHLLNTVLESIVNVMAFKSNGAIPEVYSHRL